MNIKFLKNVGILKNDNYLIVDEVDTIKELHNKRANKKDKVKYFNKCDTHDFSVYGSDRDIIKSIVAKGIGRLVSD